MAEDERFRERFLRESERAASLDHPNIVPIAEAGEAGGLLFVAMRHVDGTDLKALLKRQGALEPGHALALLGQVASALDSARWAHGLVHGNIKPSNILTSETAGPGGTPRVNITDCGLWRQVDGSPGTDGVDAPDTRIDYLAPEKIRGERPSSQSDQYALACVFYETLAGSAPFRRRSRALSLGGHLHGRPPPLGSLEDDLGCLDPIIARALAKAPAERFVTCSESIQAADTALSGAAAASPAPLNVTAHPPSR